MNAFETFLLTLAKDAVAVAPAVAPIFISAGNSKAVAIFNVSDEFMQAALSQIPTAAAPAAVPAVAPAKSIT